MVMSYQNLYTTPLNSRKRYAPDTPSSPPNDKRQRPNLACGFSGLSLGSAVQSIACENDASEEDAASLPASDLGVEEVDTSSTSSSEGTVDSDSTFRMMRRPRRRRKRPLQPDCVEQPVDQDPPPRPLKRPHFSGNDTISEQQQDDINMDEDMGDIPRRSRRRRTEWHEPEKDREYNIENRLLTTGIVITSLGSPNSSQSSSRSTSPQRHLSQPGAQGFTLSPSLLTHLLNSHRNTHTAAPAGPRDLVVYRSPTWDRSDLNVVSDANRFQEIDDEDMMDIEE